VISAEEGRNGPLVERDRELARIARCLQRAEQGHGGALAVEGPAGIGKTVLLAAAREGAQGDGFQVLRGRGAELEREFAFGVVRQLIEPVVVGATEEERARLLDGPPGVAARLLGLPGFGDEEAGGTPVGPDPSFAVLHGLYWLCANLAAERPLALVVDDAHWADSPSLRFLAFLLPRLEDLRVVVLLGARPVEAGPGQGLLAALMVDPATEVVNVPPLSRSGVAKMVAAGLGADQEPGFSTACWEATGGTPFLVRTLLEAVREEGLAPVAASAAKVQNIATATLGRWAMLRLAGLGPDAAGLARAVATLERAELSQAAQLAGLTALDGARAAQLLVRAGMLVEAPLSFAHALIRAAVYREVPLGERSEAHGRAARMLAEGHASPALVAEHLLATAPAGDGWVVAKLRAAAREATARGAPESVAVYLRRALTEPPPPEAAADVLLELGRAEFTAGQSGWHEHLEAAVESAADDTTRISAALVLAIALRMQQRFADAVEICDRVAAQAAGREPEARWRLEAMAVVCGLLDSVTAATVSVRARALISKATRQAVPRPALAVAAYAAGLTNQPATQVAELARGATALKWSPLLEPGESRWLSSAVFGLFWAEHYVEAQTLLDSTIAEARGVSNEIVVLTFLVPRAWMALRRGDLTAAEADARAVLDAPGRSAPPLLRFIATGVLVDALVERGQYDLAEHELEPAAADLQGTTLTTAALRYARARLRVAQWRFGDALADLRAVGDIAIRAGAISPSFLAWRSEAALAALSAGDPDTSSRLSEEELDLARAFGAKRALGVALRASGLVAGGRRGQALLGEAIEVLAGADTRLEQARARADLGALLRRANHRVEARHLLRQAVDTAYRLGATALAGRAETELRATGAKPRRVLLSGLEALTASERRIAELAAEGLTNREIAQTLFVTARTVEGHLTNVFNKLDVKARTALPAALAAPTQAVRA
jgi:DNA-binding CsgD family transcriptional regulator